MSGLWGICTMSHNPHADGPGSAGIRHMNRADVDQSLEGEMGRRSYVRLHLHSYHHVFPIQKPDIPIRAFGADTHLSAL